MTLRPLIILASILAAAQTPRDDWQHLRNSFLEDNVTHTLADAPLSTSEREQLYQVIYDNLHDSFTKEQQAKQREIVLSARVGVIQVGSATSSQVLLQAPRSFCGATGNCSILIFVREQGKLRLVLETGGGVFIVRDTSSHGLHDIATGWHISADEEGFGVYRWNGTKYEQVDCYSARSDPGGRDRAPVITACPKKVP